MKSKKIKAVNIAAAIIFAGAFFVNIHSNSHVGMGLLGIPAIGGGTGSGGSDGTGSGKGQDPVELKCYDSTGAVTGFGNTCQNGTGTCHRNDCPFFDD